MANVSASFQRQALLEAMDAMARGQSAGGGAAIDGEIGDMLASLKL